MLNANRTNLVDAFTALRTFSNVASRVLTGIRDDFTADFKDLYPVVKAFNDNADDFITDLGSCRRSRSTTSTCATPCAVTISTYS